jgi:hypothetical protein
VQRAQAVLTRGRVAAELDPYAIATAQIPGIEEVLEGCHGGVGLPPIDAGAKQGAEQRAAAADRQLHTGGVARSLYRGRGLGAGPAPDRQRGSKHRSE